MASTHLQKLLTQLEGISNLFEPEQLRRRIEALDQLDASYADAGLQATSANAMRTRLEAANAAVYAFIRSQIQQGSARDAMLPDALPPHALPMWIERCADSPQATPAGLHYDCLDELIGGVLQLHEPDSAYIRPGPEMVFYQPTPARHILHMLRLCALTDADTLIDLGSGLGHVPILTALLTEARAIGIELESAYIATARDCARSLNLHRAAFIQQNAIDADLSNGTVFYLYTPFTGSILDAALRKLREQSRNRFIRICTFGPCTQTVAQEPWLTAANATTATDQIARFRTRD